MQGRHIAEGDRGTKNEFQLLLSACHAEILTCPKRIPRKGWGYQSTLGIIPDSALALALDFRVDLGAQNEHDSLTVVPVTAPGYISSTTVVTEGVEKHVHREACFRS